MLSLSEKDIRASFVNTSRKETTELSLPAAFAELDWQNLDYLGWRDRKIARRAYVVVPVDGQPVGILLRQAEAGTRSRAQCSWCHDVTLPNPVAFFGAKR